MVLVVGVFLVFIFFIFFIFMCAVWMMLKARVKLLFFFFKKNLCGAFFCSASSFIGSREGSVEEILWCVWLPRKEKEILSSDIV